MLSEKEGVGGGGKGHGGSPLRADTHSTAFQSQNLESEKLHSTVESESPPEISESESAPEDSA
jgi:hypothetical protein